MKESIDEKHLMEKCSVLTTNRIETKMLEERYAVEIVSKLTLTSKEIEKLNG